MSTATTLLDFPVEQQVSAKTRSAKELLARFCDAEDVLNTATARASAFAAGMEDDRFAALIAAADVVSGLALVREFQRQEIDEFVAELAQIVDLPPSEVRARVYLDVIRDPRLLALPPALSIETTLRLLVAFAPVAGASFWVRDPDHSLRCVAGVGNGVRRLRAAAETALRGEQSTSDAVPVRRWERVSGALSIRPQGGGRDVFVHEAARILGLALERELLLERGAARERSLVAVAERRLTRFGYDVHDGPLQDIGAARRELLLLRDALDADDLPARLAEIEAVVSDAERALRQLAQAAESPAAQTKSFRALLEAEVRSAVAAAELEGEVRMTGDLDTLSGSQRIALMHVVQEALANVREHSGATAVRVSVARQRDRVEAEIVDNGRGFEVERTLVRVARKGRLGLVGMSERVLLLGGAFDVRSRPGGPTSVCVTLPEWRPLGTRQEPDEDTVDLDASVAWG